MKNTDFSEVHTAMVDSFDKALTNVAKEDISSFELAKLTGSITEPTILLEVSNIEVDQNQKGSAGVVWLKVNYQAHCILPKQTGDETIACLDLASVVIKTVNQNRWGLSNVGIPTMLTGYPSYHSSSIPSIESFVVAWWQLVAVDSSWSLSQVVAEEIYLSEAPEIGAAHIDKYEKLEDEFAINTPAP